MIPAPIQKATAWLRQRLEFSWDADDSMGRPYVESSPLGVLVRSFEESFQPNDLRRRLGLLTVFVARRALPCWERWSQDDSPRQLVFLLENWVQNTDFRESWEVLARLPEPDHQGRPIQDCRRSGIKSAAQAVSNAALFLSRRDPIYAIYGLSAADMAFDESFAPTDDDFRKWLVEIAVPAASANRELTAEERSAFRNYSDADVAEWRSGTGGGR